MGRIAATFATPDSCNDRNTLEMTMSSEGVEIAATAEHDLVTHTGKLLSGSLFFHVITAYAFTLTWESVSIFLATVGCQLSECGVL